MENTLGEWSILFNCDPIPIQIVSPSEFHRIYPLSDSCDCVTCVVARIRRAHPDCVFICGPPIPGTDRTEDYSVTKRFGLYRKGKK